MTSAHEPVSLKTIPEDAHELSDPIAPARHEVDADCPLLLERRERYAVFDSIGSGGMASVHLGVALGALGFSRLVAVKRLHAQFARNQRFVKMLFEEARLASRVRHISVVQIHDVLASPSEVFVVMEYVRGPALADLVRLQRAQCGGAPPQCRPPPGRDKVNQAIKRILIAVDLVDTDEAVPQEAVNAAHTFRDPRRREAARCLIDEVVPLAQVLGASIEIVYVRETRAHHVAGGRPHADEVDDWIDEHLEMLAHSVINAGVSCVTTSLEGSVHRALVAHAKKTSPDLVVLGSYQRWHWLESCAEHILLEAHRHILVLPIGESDR